MARSEPDRLNRITPAPQHKKIAVPTEEPHMISAVPLTHVSAEDAAAWHAVVAASLADDLPEEPRPTFEQVHAQLTVAGRDNRRLLWHATATDGTVVGVAGLRLFTSPGQKHLAELELHVTPDQRRSGVGSHLLATAVEAAQAEQRRSLIADVVEAADRRTPSAPHAASGGCWQWTTCCSTSRWPTMPQPAPSTPATNW